MTGVDAAEIDVSKLVCCGACGAVVAAMRAHSAWHAQLDGTGAEANILAWLDSLDVQEVERLAFTDMPMSASPVACVLDALRRMAGER